MGLFDFFNKKGKDKSPPPDLFSSFKKYSEYVVHFINMQQNGNFAPISAYEKPNGELIGYLYLNGSDGYSLSATQAVQKLNDHLSQKLSRGEIKSYAVFYHSPFNNDNNHSVAEKDEDLRAISVRYNFSGGMNGYLAFPYRYGREGYNFTFSSEFSQEQNLSIFNTQPVQGKDYFQERVEITSEVIESPAGIKIRKSNTYSLSDTWAGIFGFENFRNGSGSNVLQEHFGLAFASTGKTFSDNIQIHSLDYTDITFKAIAKNGRAMTLMPVVKTTYSIPVGNKEINEWENVDNVEAIITGGGRDTFGIKYFATDYAENRQVYHTNKNLNVKLSGIVYVLDSYKIDNSGEVKYSEDFTAYMPNKDMAHYACFDFIGEVEDFRETSLLSNNSLKGYIMKVRLITNSEVKDFFTIDMYVTPANMRFRELVIGMKVTGMFQLQGQIA